VILNTASSRRLTATKMRRSSFPFHFRLVNLSENIRAFSSIITDRKRARRLMNRGDPVIVS